MLALVVPPRLFGPRLPDYLHELLRPHIALVVVREIAVCRQLRGVPTRHNIDQHSAAGKLVERIRHLRGKRRSHEPGSHRNQELELLRPSGDDSRHQPRVLARRAHRHKRKREAGVLRCLRHLDEIVERGRAGRRPDDLRIVHRRQKPPEFDVHLIASSIRPSAYLPSATAQDSSSGTSRGAWSSM